MSRKRLRDPKQPMTRRDLYTLHNAEEGANVDELLDMTASTNGIAHALLEELTLADLARLGVRIRQAPR